MLFLQISHIPAMAIGFVSAMLPLQTSASSCGYAVAAGLINIMRSSAYLAGFEDQELERETYANLYIPAFENDQALAQTYRKASPISLADIKAILARQGIDSMAFKFSPGVLHRLVESLDTPLILHIRGRFSHFVLIIDAKLDAEEDAESAGILLFDPSCGLALLSESELKSLVSGYCLLPIRYACKQGEKPVDIKDLKPSLDSLEAFLWSVFRTLCSKEEN